LSHATHHEATGRPRRRLVPLIAGAAAVALAAGSTMALAVPETARAYRPIQSISYDLGSKRAVGYFEQKDGACHLVLMVAEAAAVGTDDTPSAARLRLDLTPGQRASLDSEQGSSIDVTCGDRGETLLVDRGVATD
jgi:hypothetical protein